jgi:hypothetical protein
MPRQSPRPTEIDTFNAHLVAIVGRNAIVVGMPPRGPLTREQALTFAAWLVVSVEISDARRRAEIGSEGDNVPSFDAVLNAVRNT